MEIMPWRTIFTLVYLRILRREVREVVHLGNEEFDQWVIKRVPRSK
jgi:hypothetical protein